jgi:hypothetical protein
VSAHSCLDIVSRTNLLAVSPQALAQRQVALGRAHILRRAPELAGMAISAIWRRSCSADPIMTGFKEALVAVTATAGVRPGRRMRTPGRA